MKVNFLRVSELELNDAVSYFNEQSEGLGFEFANEVKRTIKRILDFPEAWANLSLNTRRARTNRFPYGVIYSHTEDELLILGVMHLHRDPEYWKDRI
ncbi:MAG: hypothetical protein OCD02_10350 [Spirochaetaceae bacterium]